jgi:hypothetical protein
MHMKFQYRSGRNLVLLAGGATTGLLLARELHSQHSFGTITSAFLLLVPFGLAALTGMAKTTTV